MGLLLYGVEVSRHALEACDFSRFAAEDGGDVTVRFQTTLAVVDNHPQLELISLESGGAQAYSSIQQRYNVIATGSAIDEVNAKTRKIHDEARERSSQWVDVLSRSLAIDLIPLQHAYYTAEPLYRTCTSSTHRRSVVGYDLV